MATKNYAQTFSEQLQGIIAEFRAIHGDDHPFQMPDVAAWAMRTGRFQWREQDRIKIVSRMFSKAARDEYYTDPQNRRVRTKHAVRSKVVVDGEEKQQYFWDDIRTAEPKHMRVSLQQRRLGILNDCKQHKTDADSYNDNNIHGAQLSFEYNFEPDLEEMELATEYPESRPEEDEDEIL